MKATVFWLLVTCHTQMVENSFFDEFGRYHKLNPSIQFVCDSTQHQKEFPDTTSAKNFTERMKKECDRCIFVKIDTISIKN